MHRISSICMILSVFAGMNLNLISSFIYKQSFIIYKSYYTALERKIYALARFIGGIFFCFLLSVSKC